MGYNKNDMLRESVIPVLLGDSAAAHLLAFRIYLRFGITSYICDSKRGLLGYIDPFSKFFSVGDPAEPRAVLDALDYLSAGKDYLPIILPCCDRFSELTEKNRDFLEARFILSDRASFFNKKPMSVLKKGASYEN